MFRIASFNLESLTDDPAAEPPLAERLAVLRPQLLRLRADVLCLQEVNATHPDPKTPRRFGALDALCADTPYAAYERAHSRASSGAPMDRHNLLVLSRFPIRQCRQVRQELVSPPRYRLATAAPAAESDAPIEWDRPLLHVTVELPEGVPMHIVNLHLRAPLAAPVPGQKLETFVWKSIGGWAEGYYLASIKRAGQALEARLLVEQILDADPEALLLVCGDFNAEEGEVPVRILHGGEEDTGNGALARRTLVALERSLPPEQRFSVLHNGRKQMLDHMLASRALLGWYRELDILNEDLGDELVAYRGVRHPPGSFHAGLVAQFEMPQEG